MKAVFDTNILIDYLRGVEPAASELRRYNHRLISQISWMEVMVGCRDEDDELKVRAFLDTFTVKSIDNLVAESAIMLRRGNGLRLPDAIILATAECHQAILVTRDTRDFPTARPGVHVPYKL